MNNTYLLPILAVGLLTSSAHSAVISDPGFDSSLTSGNPVTNAAPIYNEWVTFSGTYQFEIGGTAPNTYLTSNHVVESGNRFVFQMIEDDKATTGEITIEYDLNNGDTDPVNGDGFTLNLYVYGFNKDQSGGWSIATNTLAGTSDALFTDVTALSDDTGGWQTFTTTVNLGATGYDQLAIGFGATGYHNGFEQLQIDNVSIVIPEPASQAMLGLATLTGLLLFRRR